MKLAIIGGSLCSKLEQLTSPLTESIHTPYGETSAAFVSGKIANLDVVYLNRHGNGHQFAPHQINYRANLFALKLLDVTDIVAVAAVGGMTEAMAPMKIVIADQLIDYTHGRAQTYNDIKDDSVNHIDFSWPFDENLRQQLIKATENTGLPYEPVATYGATQGPRLETIAEIRRMQRDGCNIVGMTGMPEASLARELDMAYANLSLVVNWAAGADPAPPGGQAGIISMVEISRLMQEGDKLIHQVLEQLFKQLNSPST